MIVPWYREWESWAILGGIVGTIGLMALVAALDSSPPCLRTECGTDVGIDYKGRPVITSHCWCAERASADAGDAR